MSTSVKELLFLLGWNDFFEGHSSQFISESLTPARIIGEEKGLYRAQGKDGVTFFATIRGKMQHTATAREDYPAVGDWVMVDRPSGAERGIIHHLLPRRAVLYRKQIGSSSDAQILASNVDTIFITTSMNEDLNYRRLDRYLAVAWESGSQPVLLLTKADLFQGDIHEKVAEVEDRFPGVPVHFISQTDFAQNDFLARYLARGKTAVFIGSSGVGKSTLVNFLITEDDVGPVKTQSIRDDDGKGRHTTTSRSLYHSRYGGLVIDTPGMRELSLSDHSEGLETQFADIEEWTSQCRFSDCRHETEPGCAIKMALDAGELTWERWQNYKKLEAEVHFALRKQDKALASEERKLWKKISLQARENSMRKRRF